MKEINDAFNYGNSAVLGLVVVLLLLPLRLEESVPHRALHREDVLCSLVTRSTLR